MSGGRPSLYDPKYCDKVLEYGTLGKSVAWMAATIGVDRTTIEIAWPKAHPEFSIALTRARLLSQLWWEDKGQDNMTTPGFNASVWSRSMAARFPADWREVKGSEISGPNGAPVETVSRIELVAVVPDDHGKD
jgi:hypothetical protein